MTRQHPKRFESQTGIRPQKLVNSNSILTIPRNSNITKTLAVIAVEMLWPKGFGRTRLRRITDASAHQAIPFVKDVVQAGATVHTDGSAAYRSLKDEGYTHQRTVMMGSETPAHISMPGVHRVASLIQ